MCDGWSWQCAGTRSRNWWDYGTGAFILTASPTLGGQVSKSYAPKRSTVLAEVHS
ncbi:hypothetical protein BAUCODRAFT_36287, partial [Baudoinia panamericana UAMH 10762]